jgi:hypothetical protein
VQPLLNVLDSIFALNISSALLVKPPFTTDGTVSENPVPHRSNLRILFCEYCSVNTVPHMQEEEAAVAEAEAVTEVTEATKGVVDLEAVVGVLMLWTWTMMIAMLMKGRIMMRWTLSLAGIVQPQSHFNVSMY